MKAATEIATNGQTSFWLIGGEVYRAPSQGALDSWGHPLGKRWECSSDHWEKFRLIYDWVKDVSPLEPSSPNTDSAKS